MTRKTFLNELKRIIEIADNEEIDIRDTIIDIINLIKEFKGK